MPYDAITIDANIAIQNGINLESGLLAQLFQFKDGPVDFVISDVVFGEIAKHLTSNTKKARDSAISAVRKAIDLKLAETAAADALRTSVDELSEPRAAVRARLQQFLEATGATPIPSSLVTAGEVTRLYFAAKPPFEEAGPKKSEFPDAVALLALDRWAENEGKRILAVSADKGWKAFADGTANIDVEVDLATALATLQQHTEQAAGAVAALLGAMEAGAVPDAADDVARLLGSSVADLQVYAEAESLFNYEVDLVQLELENYEFKKVNGNYDLSVVRMGNNEVVARVAAQLEIKAEAEFSLSVRDSIDKDYVGMGSASAERQLETDTHVLLTVVGNLEGPVDELQVTAAEVVDNLRTVDFGMVNIDYEEEDDYQDWLEEDAEAEADGEAGGQG